MTASPSPASPADLSGPAAEAQQRASTIVTRFARNVAGVTGVLLASLDGRALAAELTEHGHRQTAAIVASSLGLGSRLAELTGAGDLHEIVVRSGTGYVAIYAVGDNGALIVLTRPSANLALLHLKTRDIIDDLSSAIADLQAGDPVS